MSVCAPTEEESSEEGGPAREAYEQKAVSKVVRVLTVLAYLLSVSLAAILLSVYYVCVWRSPELPPLNGTGDAEVAALAARRADPPHYNGNGTQPIHTGGGGVPVNDTSSQTASAITDGFTATSSERPPSTQATQHTVAPHSTVADVNGTDALRADNSSVT